MPRTLIAGERARLASAYNLHTRLWLEDATGVLRDMTSYLGVNWLLSASGSASVDEPVSTATFTLRLTAVLSDGTMASLAPLFGDNPANDGGPVLWAAREARYLTAVTAPNVAPISGDWRTRFHGVTTLVNVGGGDGTVTVNASDMGAVLGRTSITETRPYGSAGGVPVEDVIQAILDDNLATPVELVTPVSPGWLIREYAQDQTFVLEAVRALALQIGWDVRYQFRPGQDTPQLVFSEPPRGNASPDWVFPASEYETVARDEIGDSEVRNRARIGWVDPASGEAQYVTVDNVESQSQYDVRFMAITEDATSNIDTESEAVAMGEAAVSDLGTPFALADITGADFWPLQVNDVVAFGPNADRWDSTRVGAVRAFTWTHENGDGSVSISIADKPAGAYRDWLDREGSAPPAPPAEDAALRLEGFREKGRDSQVGVTYAWDDGDLETRCAEIWTWSRTVPVGSDAPRWPGEDDAPSEKLPPTTREFTIPYPPLGSVTYVRLVPMTEAFAFGDAEDVTLTSVGAPPRFGRVDQYPSPSGLSVTLAMEILDPQGFGGTLRVWTNHDDVADAEPGVAPEGIAAIASTPVTVTGVTQFAVGPGTQALLSGIRVQPNRGKTIFREFRNSVGTSTGVQRLAVLASGGGIIDAAGNIIDGGIIDARQFVAGLTPPRVVATLPPDGTAAGFAVNEQAVNGADGMLYLWTGSAWKPVVNAPDLQGQVVTGQIADAAINTAKFAAGIQPVAIIADRTAPYTGVGAALDTATGALVRWNGSAWIDDVPTASLVGTLTGSQIGAGAVGAVQLATAAVTSAKVAVGAIDTVAIAASAITAAKLGAAAVGAAALATGAVTAAALAANAVTAPSIATGAIGAVALAAGAVTAPAIAASAVTAGSIAAGAVTAGSIAANAVTASALAAGSVTAGAIAAAAITATAIAAGSVTAASLAANSVTSAAIQAGAVTAGSLAAGAVIAGTIAAGAVSATSLASSSVTTAALAAGAVTTVTLAADAVTAAKLAAGSVTATAVAAGAITAGAIAANAVTAGTIDANAVTAGKIAANAVTAGTVAANAVTAGTIAAGAVNATELAAGAVVAGKLAAGAVTAGTIAVGAVTAVTIAADAVTTVALAAGSITAAKLAVNSVTAAAISAGAITATAIQAKAVKATHLEVAVLSDVKDASGNTLGLGIIVSGKLTSVDGTRYLELNAAGAAAFLYHPALGLYANGTAVFGGQVSSDTFTTGHAYFSGRVTLNAAGSGAPNGTLRWFDSGAGIGQSSASLACEPGSRLRLNAYYGMDISANGGNTIQLLAYVDANAGLTVAGTFYQNAGNIGVFGASPVGRQNVTGTQDGNSALGNLLVALENLGWITDATSP